MFKKEEEEMTDDFPYPGERVLAQWVSEEVRHLLRRRASNAEILKGVESVLEEAERNHGTRPVKGKASA